MRTLMRTSLIIPLLALVVAPIGGSAAARQGHPAAHPAALPGNAVITWNDTAATAALDACLAPVNNPLHESRMYTTMHLAIHDALNAIKRHSRPYALDIHVPGASARAAVAAAAHGVPVPLLQELPAPFSDCVTAAEVVGDVDAAYATALDAVPAGVAKTRGVALGQAAAAVMLAVRTEDGSNTALFVTDYAQGTEPGQYRFTPGQTFAFAPGWGDVTPFALSSGLQFTPGPPYPVTSRRYAKDFNEVRRLGGDGAPRRATARPTRRSSPTSGWRARRCSGTGSPASWPAAAASTCGRARGCSVCSTWRWRTATSRPSR